MTNESVDGLRVLRKTPHIDMTTMNNYPKTPRDSGSKKGGGSSQSDTAERTVVSGNADAADAELKRSDSEEREEHRVSDEVGAVEDSNEFPKEIKGKKYCSWEAFEKDLEKYGLGDCNYIALDNYGRAYKRMAASKFHIAAVEAIQAAVKGADAEVYFDKERAVKTMGHGGLVVQKQSDTAIWGEGRFTNLGVETKRLPDERRIEYMNPNVIIEFSWEDSLSTEICKFNDLMTKHVHPGVLGRVEVGFLIKTIPLSNNVYPGENDSIHEVKKKPICGFDVFKAYAGHSLSEDSVPHLRYRIGEGEDSTIEITRSDLGEGGCEQAVLISIPLSGLQVALEKFDVVFKPENDQPDDNTAGAVDKVPKEMKKKRYKTLEEFDKDLEKYGLGDSNYILLDNNGRAYSRAVASKFHFVAVDAIEMAVKKAEAGVYAKQGRPLTISYPGRLDVDRVLNLAIWGKGRIENGEPAVLSTSDDPDGRWETMNPNVIIEFSWEDSLSTKIGKFNDLMTKHMYAGVLGEVKVGFLIKTIPLLPSVYPGKRDTNRVVKTKPICGFDVFKTYAGESVSESSDPYLRYRVGKEDNSVIEITGQDLGEDTCLDDVLISIPLSAVQKALEKRGVVFKPENGQQDDTALA